MVLLILFALLAGAGTALSPCVLPVLPAVLSAGVTGGRRRPLGIVAGLVISFTFAIVALVYVIGALGLPNDLVRWIAIAVLAIFGVTLVVPSLSDRIEAWIGRAVPGPRTNRGDGFGAGFLVGLSLGLVYAPCAGPILAGVITVSAAQDFSTGRLAVAIAYAIGSGVVLYALMVGGRRLTDRLAPIRGQVQVAMGAVMICVATLMAFNLDIRFQTAIAGDLPGFLVNPTESLEENSTADKQLAELRRGPAPIVPTQELQKLDQTVNLPNYGPAPEFTDPGMWFNTGNGSPSMASLRGRVVLIDFWTYTCINCIRTLPRVESLYRQYEKDGLTVVGVHTPEFPFERESGNVGQAIADNHLTYPVVQDNAYGTWDAYGNNAWPAEYLIDARGNVRYGHIGEGGEEETERAIRTLLREAGNDTLGGPAPGHAQPVPRGQQTPETYLGSARAVGFANGRIEAGHQDFGLQKLDLAPDQFAYGGNWAITPESATAGAGATLDVEFRSQQVFLVLGSPRGPRPLQVELDGKPISVADAGADVKKGTATISGQRLYRLVDLPAAGLHRLTLRVAPGISGYAFTFG